MSCRASPVGCRSCVRSGSGISWIQGRLVHTGRTSMHIALRVLAGSPRTGELELATQCTSVYVALDAEGRPDPVPTWSPTTSVDLAAQQHAVEFMALRTDPAFHSPAR